MQVDKNMDRVKTLVRPAQSLTLRVGHQQITPTCMPKALLDDEHLRAKCLADQPQLQIPLTTILSSGPIANRETAGVIVQSSQLAINTSKPTQAA